RVFMKRFDKPNVVVAIAALAVILAVASAGAQGTLKVGDNAPDFPHPFASTAGEPGKIKIQMSDFLGKKNIVLAFYVADWTGG
ncbi:MAG: hypothetical protein V3U22_03345, partial [Vicinamibacteria bacterium]